MRVLLVGTAPPPGGSGAYALAARARELADAGDEVIVLSGDLRSAADRHARLEGAALALYLVYFAHRFDRLELRVEPALAASAPGRAPRSATLFLLAAALGHWRQVTYRVDHPVPPDLLTRRARRFWRQAGEIVVADADDVARLAGAGLGRAEARTVTPPVPDEDATPLGQAVGAGRTVPPRRLIVLLAYERARHLAAIALKGSSRGGARGRDAHQ